ncbi:MAG: ABC transporter ATP-binding protein, partial [Acetobacteraceae bacterium]
MATVELINVEKSFGRVQAVANVSLRIAEGEFVALLGPSGCGKTTTLNLLAGFIEPTGGDIRFNGTSIARMPPHRRNIGVVFQSYALFPHMTVFQNVAFGLEMRKVPRADVATRVRRALDIVHLTQMEDRNIRQLSGGQQQRVALARALVIEPAVLLLDEPLSNLDATLREQMRFEIREIQQRVGITTVFVTHDQSEAMAAADRLVVMDKGAICQVGTAREIYERPVNTFVAGFIGQANLLPGTVRLASGIEVQVELPGGAVVTAAGRPGLQPGQDVTLMLRPEDAAVEPQAPAQGNALPGTVLRASMLGATVNIGVSVGDQVVSVIAPRGVAVPPVGSAAFVTWNPSSGLLF